MLIALHADDAVVGRRELLIADLLVALVALETFRVPLSSFVLEFLHSCKKKLSLPCDSPRRFRLSVITKIVRKKLREENTYHDSFFVFMHSLPIQWATEGIMFDSFSRFDRTPTCDRHRQTQTQNESRYSHQNITQRKPIGPRMHPRVCANTHARARTHERTDGQHENIMLREWPAAWTDRCGRLVCSGRIVARSCSRDTRHSRACRRE